MVVGARVCSNACRDACSNACNGARAQHAIRLQPNFTPAMTIDLTSVAIVLDPDFGAELHQLAAQMPVWIVDSPGNRPAIEAEWTRRRRDGAVRELSVFRAIDGLAASGHLAALLRTIDAAHGPSAQDPAFRTLLVFGATADDTAEAAVRALGGAAPVATASGFRVAFVRAKA